MRYRKKPVVIDAIQWTGRNLDDVSAFLGGTHQWHLAGTAISLAVPGGRADAEIGDWIVRGIANEVYPCKPDIFEATYEAA